MSVFRYMGVFAKTFEAVVLKKRIPVRLDFNITKKCNLRCPYCYVDFKQLDEIEDLSFERIVSTIDDFHSRGMRAVRLMGGEPLIREDIGKIIEHIKRKGIVCEINSNGYFVRKRFEDIKAADSLCLSLDGDREANDRIRGKGCYDKVIDAIEFSLGHGMPVRIHSMLSKYTVGSLEHIGELCKKYGVTFSYAPCCLPGTEDRDPNLFLSMEELRTFFEKYHDMKRRGYPIITTDRAIEAMLNWPLGDKFLLFQEDIKKGMDYVRCQYGHRSCYVDVDGMMYACSGRWGVGINYFENGFENAWDYLQKNVSCVSCRTINDFSLALNLDPSAVSEMLSSMIKGRM